MLVYAHLIASCKGAQPAVGLDRCAQKGNSNRDSRLYRDHPARGVNSKDSRVK